FSAPLRTPRNIPESCEMNELFTGPLAVRLVIIDLDGTLIDTAPDLATSANAMLEELGMDVYDHETVATWIGNGISRFVKRALTGELDGEPDQALYDRAYPILLRHYAERVSRESRPYPGVTEGLAELRTGGFELACITNKAEAFTRPLLKDLGLADYFKLVLSGDSLPRRKPDPLPLLHACEVFDIAPAQGVLVGDSANDTEAAQAAGMPVICVTYGYNRGLDVRTLGPVAVIDSLTELPRHIRPLES
ncbi:MAG: phosphoglycolate phosphatase, partial [Acidiferrobacterales bacterium]|nr:phosphoglycolate phosphatase [Acidiferrobacterales bacterium]